MTNAPDVSAQAQIFRLLLRLRDENKISILFVTHDLAYTRELIRSILPAETGEN
ncbi:MAG: hypothetical protein LUF34_11860 [Lachnospiraceae bacterium]|nr:hypothetical protein [Lachnospiraceae bacterium]